ncbi:MAG TPA: AMP-binding protein [Acidimicrobiales bacterium]|jgi:long-chain acyl-CoA synthetase|nr:AMP-binding protein [Acidimicrobiales bacterium]
MTEPEQGTPEYWAALRPEAPAVMQGERVLTYAEWNTAADRVAEGLAQMGLQSGDRLGMRFRLGFEWFVIQRALQKLGVAQVAVNWKLTADEAAYIIRDSGARGLACNDAEPSGWAAQALELLVTVGQPVGSAGFRYEDLAQTECPTVRFGARSPAMILYTSGTTGAPRGVPPIDPSSADIGRLLRYGASIGRVPPHPNDSVCLLTLPTHHGAGPRAATGACAKGGIVVLLDPFDPEESLRLIERHRVQVWTAVPTMLLRIQNLPREVFSSYDLSSLIALNTGAAPVPQSLKEWIVKEFGDHVLWETYGASEAGMISYTSPEHQLSKPGTSGVPYDEVDIAIVDDEWNCLLAGETGEIAVKTPVVIDHYLGRDPLGDDTLRDGYYRTGDVGHLDEDGFLFITDRIKDMIVAGGVNIYPAEIEKALIAHPGIIDAAVIGIPQADFGEQPLAFIVADRSGRPSASDLVSFLQGRLASYKHPRQFEFVDDLPRNSMGKVLKTELRAPYWAGRDRHV